MKTDYNLITKTFHKDTKNGVINLCIALTKQDEEHPVFCRLFKDLEPFRGFIVHKEFNFISTTSQNSEEFTDFDKRDMVIFVISRNTHSSEWVIPEFLLYYSELVKKNKSIFINIRIDDVKTPYLLSSLSTIDLFEDYTLKYSQLFQILNINNENTTGNGIIIDTVSILNIAKSVSLEMVEYYSRNPKQLYSIDRRLFEQLVAHLFDKFGFEVELTKHTRDGGRDIIAIKNDIVKVKYLIECKRPDLGGYVGIKPVRELFGVLKDEKATKGILVTTSHFSKDANLFLERHIWELELKDFNGLMSWINEYRNILGRH